jgi:Fur family zinc uptake transcriptional regulator
MTNTAFDPHDHSACISDAMSVAETYCAENKLQFTPVRRRVLEILLEKHRALVAYDILSDLDAEGFGSQPPVVYRALDFLVSHGFAHKIEQLNAYAACTHPGAEHVPAFLICRACGAVEEARAQPMQGALGRVARDAGFVIERAVIEAQGLCPKCQEAAA